MGLFDLLMSKAGPSPAPSQAEPGIMSKLNYGGVPMGIRLMTAIEALQSVNNPDMARPGLALMARSKEKYDEQQKEDQRLKELTEKAERLAKKVELTNPTLAEALRSDPTLVEDYGKGLITDSFETNRYKRTRADQVEDRNFNAGVQREGWGVADARQEDSQQHDLDLAAQKAKLEQEAEVAKMNRDSAIRAGRVKDAQLIVQGFLEQTGVDIGMPGAESPAVPNVPSSTAPGPMPVPAPMPGTLDGAPAPRQAPGLLNPDQSVGVVPEEQGDAAPAPPKEVQAWTTYFKDPSLTPSEVAQLSSTFKKTLSESMQSGKDPDANLALGAAAETYRQILKNRNETTTAEAARSTAETKANAGKIKDRITTEATAAKTVIGAESRAATGDNVIDAITNAEVAMDPKNADWLPSTGFGAGLAGYVGDTDYTGNARAVYNSVKTVQANLGFDALQAMRDASPTGGALGQVAVQELEMLQATVASLDPTDANFKDNLAKVKELYGGIKTRNEDYAQDIQNLRKFPTPEHIAEFDEMYGVDAHLKFTGAMDDSEEE